MNDFSSYSIEKYEEDISKYGLKNVWKKIIEYCKENKEINQFFDVHNFGELYEIGLAYLNKDNKKEQGIYYTPSDVSKILSDYLYNIESEIVCDVCCGTGNLVISYLSKIGELKAVELINSGNLYLYDLDEIALYICKNTIGILYKNADISKIHCIKGDFLDKKIKLPKNCKVISNPPYFKISKILSTWENSKIIKDSKEFYSAFMEKIIKNSVGSVIITPFSFIGGDKFNSLRMFLNNYSGFIISFDNVPGNIFRGKKHGIFNSNTSNAVRAAITVVDNKGSKGFRISPLLRFSTSERDEILDSKLLLTFLNNDYQQVDEYNKKYYKCFNEVLPLYNAWIKSSDLVFNDILSKVDTEFSLTMPKTCRYFVSATKKQLNRTGKMILNFNNLEDFEYAYCLLNSSFAYLYWRIFDGAITFADGLLKSMPIFINKLTDNQKKEIHIIVSEMISKENDYLVYKKNASEMQENIKFPDEYRKKLNKLLVSVLDLDFDIDNFDIVHSNSIFDKESVVIVSD